MTLITIILIIALTFGLTDFLTERFPRLQREIYYIAWFTVAFLFTIKYYYGADILNYVKFYRDIQNPHDVLAHPDKIPMHFEIGYALFCSILKSLGVSFYWHTAIVSVIYFVVIAKLFARIERNRSLALAILVVLDYNCIFATYRQCLAVSCFILMVLCLQDKKYFFAVLMAVLTVSFHKSGAFVIAIVLFYEMVHNKWVKPYLYQAMLVVLAIVFFMPIARLSSAVIAHLPLPESYLVSLTHHLLLGRQLQLVFLVYAVTLLVVIHFTQYYTNRITSIATAAVMGLLLTVLMYQHYYLLGRIRSYFLPLVIVFVFNMVQDAEDEHVRVPYGTLLKQLGCVVLFMYMVHSTYVFEKNARLQKNKIYTTCTVFTLIDHRASDVQKAQIKQARQWWNEDFMKGVGNKVN